MSFARRYAAAGQRATAAFEEDEVKCLRTEQIFRAKIEPIEDVSLNESTGRDARASDIFHVRKGQKADPIDLRALDIVTALGSRFQILPGKNPDNPACLHRIFHAMKLENCDQT